MRRRRCDVVGELMGLRRLACRPEALGLSPRRRRPVLPDAIDRSAVTLYDAGRKIDQLATG